MCITAQAADPTKPGVWWRDDADWKLYDVLQSAAILTAIAGGVSKVDLPGVASLKYKGGATYKVDLYNMKQINVASGYTRDVKVVLKAAPGTPVTDDNASVKEELQACKESIQSLKKMVLKLESDLLAVRLEVLEGKAKRGVSKESICERCDSGKYSELDLSEEDY